MLLLHLFCIFTIALVCYIWVVFGLQKEVYEKTTKDLIESVIDGFNATVFAYGPTGKLF